MQARTSHACVPRDPSAVEPVDSYLSDLRAIARERADRVFVVVLAAQLLAGTCAAIAVGWNGVGTSAPAPLWGWLVGWALLSAAPLLLLLRRPAWTAARHVVACAQAVSVWLLILLSGDRPEAYACGVLSAALLSLYRDRTVLAAPLVVFASGALCRTALAAPASLTAVGPGTLATEEGAWLLLAVGAIALARMHADRQMSLDAARVTEMQTREARLSLAESLAHLGSWEWEASTGAVAWSDQQYRLVGYEPGACMPSMALYLEAVHPDDREDVRTLLGGALRGHAFDCEHRLLTPAGTTRVVHARASVLTDAHGRVTRIVGVAQDITDQRADAGPEDEIDVTLSRRPTPMPRPATPNTARPLTTKPRARVLVVEDDAVTLQLTLHQLQTLGYDVHGVASGQDALEALSGGWFDAVLMDCQMPGMDGLETTRRIRDLEGPVGLIPIVALTAQSKAGLRDECFAAGMDDFLRKPVLPRHLADALARWVDLRPRVPLPTSVATSGASDC